MAERVGGRPSQVGLLGALPHGPRQELRGEEPQKSPMMLLTVSKKLEIRRKRAIEAGIFVHLQALPKKYRIWPLICIQIHQRLGVREGESPAAGHRKTGGVPPNFPREGPGGAALQICKDNLSPTTFILLFCDTSDFAIRSGISLL